MRNRLTLIFSILILTISCKDKETKSENKNSNIAQFRFIISDTLAHGKNLARISEYNKNLKENESSVIAVIIENELENGSTKIDTFSDGLKTLFSELVNIKLEIIKLKLRLRRK